MSELDDLRALARKRQRAVGKKISRIRRQVGAEIAGTSYDPRKPSSNINKLNRNQLRSYINKLNAFQSRQNQYVQLSGNVPLPRKTWLAYVKPQEKVNKLANTLDKFINPISVVNNNPNDINTIGLQKSMLGKKEYPRMTGAAMTPFRRSELLSYKVKSAEAVGILTRNALKQSSPGFLKSQVKTFRKQVESALDKMAGSEEMKQSFNELSDFQFLALWERPGTFENFFARYEDMQKRTVETIDSDDEFDELWNDESNGLLQWARSIERPKNAPI